MKNLLKIFVSKNKRNVITRQTSLPDEMQQKLRLWYTTSLGVSLAKEESHELASVLPAFFGYHCLQIGYTHAPDYFVASPIRHKVVMDLDLSHGGQGSVQFYSKPEVLAVATDSVDLVLLPHTLELNADPHEVLRESDRVLVPEGRLVIIGFNPWSFWGIRHMFSRHSGEVPWCGRFISLMRLKDWLALLGFEIESAKTFFYRLPMASEHISKRQPLFHRIGRKFWPAFGGTYILVARKRVTTLTPIRPRWRRRRAFINPGLVETRQ